ncbi:hypothetical protein O181_014955 [Austropuccinia psidii MF-1]|uniref:Uncharacterized protein n=1 Tax=Austropuccinia psidii MF-1 TaxID=1389203 RepID=A0A9Q3GQF9_9BASI|nr:hypothetical protein [Austropuccinia psidii MF-1]
MHMSPVHLRDLGFQRYRPEDRKGFFRNRRPRRGHLGHSGGWQDIEGNHTHSTIHIPIQQKPQTRGLEGYGSSFSAPQTPQGPFSMEHVQQEVQPSIPLGRTWGKFAEDLSQRNILQRPYGNHQTLQSQQEVQTSGGEGKQDKGESSHYPSYRRTTDPDREYSDSFRLTRIRPNNLSSGFTLFRNQQISGQESPFFTIPGSFKEKTRIQGRKQDLLQPKEERVRPNDAEAVGFGERGAQEPELALHNSRISSPINRNITPTQIEHIFQFAELEASHKRMKKLTDSIEKIAKDLQEGLAQLSKASEETNKRLNLVFEEQHHIKRDRDCLDQDIKELFSVYHGMKPQPQGHVINNPYHQEDIKPDAILVNKASSSTQYQDGYNMSYSEKEALKQLPEASCWPKFSGTGEYEHMELIHYIHGLFIDVPSIPDYWITARLNTAFKGHANHYANNCPKAKKKVYAIEKVPEEEYRTEDSESDPMGDAIREESDEEQDPRVEFLVKYQEETLLEFQDIQFKVGMPQEIANKNLCKHTQDAQTFVVTPTKGMAYIHGTATKMTA